MTDMHLLINEDKKCVDVIIVNVRKTAAAIAAAVNYNQRG